MFHCSNTAIFKNYFLAILTVAFLSGCSGALSASSVGNGSASDSSSTTTSLPENDVNGVFIDPSASTNGSGTLVSPYNSWSSVSIQAGKNYYQKSGTTATGIVNVTANGGTSGIKISAYAESIGVAPVLTGTFNISGASHVTISGFTVGGGTYAAVVLQNSASNITIQNNTLKNSQLAGVNITNNAAGNNMIKNNNIFGNTYYGVVIHEVDSGSASQTQIIGNTISNNGSHGIEIKGNNFVISENTVFNNGFSQAGTSGIHVYAGGYNGDPFTTFGAFNTITKNHIYSQKEPSATDGNGIQLDQKTHDNIVQLNLAHDNEGSGINLYDTYNNSIFDNFTFHNTIGTSAAQTVFTEILVTGSASYNANQNNSITHNTFLATASKNVAIFVDTRTASHTMSDGGNWIGNSAGSSYKVWTWNDSISGNSSSGWNSTKWSAGASDTILAGTPAAIGAIPAPLVWQNQLQGLGYSFSWY